MSLKKVMQCERCKAVIIDGQEKELHGQILCEDCYMDLLSPVKGCDPWAVYSAKRFIKLQGHEPQLSSLQKEILEFLRSQGPIEPDKLYKQLQVKKEDLERELASLRHMEKVRGELRDGKRYIRLWD
ncbi:MAG: hypothetical protein JW882_16845 [Deltaproteobacteria bacterium]|nr:hypothetical protein [Deltaproteobacteria bacterium]